VKLKPLLYIILILCLAVPAVPPATAQEAYRWQIDYQRVTLDIGDSGEVNMRYDVSAVIVKGNWPEVWIPATTGDTQVYSVVDGDGKPHDYSVSDGQIKVQGFDLRPGDPVALTVYSRLPGFVYQADRPEYAIVTFVPPWWDMTIPETRVTYALPAAVDHAEVFTGQREYSNIYDDQGRTVVVFEGRDLAPDQRFEAAVSFPDRYLAPGAATSKEPGPVDVTGGVSGLLDSLCGLLFCGLWLVVPAFIVLSIIMGLTRKPYSSPRMAMDGVGVNKGLDPAEAAMLLRLDPRRVLTLIMFGLMKAGNVKLVSTDPVRLEVVSKKGLNYYEKPFADAIKTDGSLDEDGLLRSFKALAQRVVDKTRPYCRRDTEEYYRNKIEEAWDAVKAVDTPELKLQKYDTSMFWLMADEDFPKKTKDYLQTPGWDTYQIPNYYWWYPYYFGFPRYGGYGGQPREGTAAPAPTRPAPAEGRPTDRTTATVESFANRVSNSVESLSAGVVGGVESFLGIRNAANAPPPAPISQPRVYTPSTSCACVSCACACVSCACACACAGGGGGCT
jgi:hypothetical protein